MAKDKKDRPYILAIDLDGVLCQYDGWKGPAHFGKPVPGVIEELYKLKREGRERKEEWAVVVLTTRRTDNALRRHLDKHNVPYDYINKHPWQPPKTSHKIVADVYLDDHGLRFTGNAKGLAGRIRAAATPWTEKRAFKVDSPPPAMLQVDSFERRVKLARAIMTPTAIGGDNAGGADRRAGEAQNS